MKRFCNVLCCLLAAILFALPLGVSAHATDCGAKLLAITYDDGPGKDTGYLLDELAARGVKATFFVNGENASYYPEILKRIVDEGHQLANHTYHHKNLNTLSSGSISSEISSVQTLITAAGGSDTAYIRPPYGNANSTVKAAATAPLISWSVDPLDWKYRNRDTVCKNIINGSYDGAIILVHDIHQTSVYGSLDAIDQLLDAGYEFVTVEELLLRRGITPQPGTIYYDAKNKGVNLSAEEISPEYYDESKLTEHWGYDAMQLCLERGYLQYGMNGEWYPNHCVTRGEFAMSLGKFCGVFDAYQSPVGNPFSDVAELDERTPYILWINDSSLMCGYDSRFRPDDNITREEIATVLARYLLMTGRTSAAGDEALSLYSDRENISDWAREGVATCTDCGILQGGATGFLPKDNLTRAQTAAILQRLANS